MHVRRLALFAVPVLLSTAGLFYTSGADFRPVEAIAHDVLTVTPNVCIALTADADWVVENPLGDMDGDLDVDGWDNALFACHPATGGLTQPSNLAAIAAALGADIIPIDDYWPEEWLECANGIDDDWDGWADDGCAEFDAGTGNAVWDDPNLWQPLDDASGSQLIEDENGEWGGLWLLSFLSNDDWVTFTADEGVWVGPIAPDYSIINCRDVAGPDTFVEEDCDDDGVQGDGMVVTLLEGNGVADRGAQEMFVRQSGVDYVVDYTVVGEPYQLQLAFVGGDVVLDGMNADQCAQADVSDFTSQVTSPQITGVVAAVTDDIGTPIAGVRTDWAVGDGGVAALNSSRTTTQDAAGEILARNLICGVGAGISSVEAVAGALGDSVQVNVSAGGRILGSIDSIGGQPLADCRVQADPLGSDVFWGEAATAPDGTYAITGLTTGNYRVEADCDGYVIEYYDDARQPDDATQVPVTEGQDTTDVDFGLTLKGTISGVVTDAEGNPLKGCHVDADPWESAGADGDAWTDSDGNYTLVGMDSGTHLVDASCDGYLREYYSQADNWDTADHVPVNEGEDTPNVSFSLDLAAPPSNVVTINPVLCFLGTAERDWDLDTDVDGDDSYYALMSCGAYLDDQDVMNRLVTLLSGDPDAPTSVDFAAIDKEAGQMHELDGLLWIVAFVSNDQPVLFSADEGVFDVSDTPTATCGENPPFPPTYDFVDEDCDADGDRGDGLIAVRLSADAGVTGRGPAHVVVTQNGTETYGDYVVVGEPDDVQVTAAESQIETGAPACVNDGDYSDAVSNAHSTLLMATVTDDDGTPLTGGLVAWETEDDDLADVVIPVQVSMDEGPLGIGAYNVLCGISGGGYVQVAAELTGGLEEGGPQFDPGAGEADDWTEVLVVAPGGDSDGDTISNGVDNCPLTNNLDQLNGDAGRRPNGDQATGTWASNPAQDNTGDACDGDEDNDGLPDYSEDPDSCPFLYLPDSDGDRALDGYEIGNGKNPCDPGNKPSACSNTTDTDADGFTDCIEHAGYNTCAFFGDAVPGYATCADPIDSDGDGCADWIEIVDVNGDRHADILDVLVIARRAFNILPPSDSDSLFDVNRDGSLNLLDPVLAARNSALLKSHTLCLPETSTG